MKLRLLLIFMLHATLTMAAGINVKDVKKITYSTTNKKTLSTVRFAAKELKSYLNKMGANVRGTKLISNRKHVAEVHLKLNQKCGLRWDGYRIKSNSKGVTIEAAEARGVLYGVYELLEQSGCWFLYPDEKWEIVPNITNLPELDLTNEPQVEWRGIALYGVRDDQIDISRATINWMSKQRYNYILLSQDRPAGAAGLAQEQFFKGRAKDELLPEIIKRDFIINLGEHNTHEYLDKNTLFKEHPEWFSEVNGRRVKGQICYSNKEAMEYYANKLTEYVAKNDWIDIVGTWPLDGGGYCKCAECTANPNAVYNGICHVAKKVKQVRPDLIVEHLAYTPETLVPPTENIPSNMAVLYCPDLGTKKNLEKSWNEHSQSAGGVYQFEYYMADHWRIRGNLWLRPDYAAFTGKYLADNNFRGTVSLYLPIQVWWKGAFNYWFLRHSLWNKNFDIKQKISSYIKAYYPGYEKQVATIFDRLLYDLQKDDYFRADNFAQKDYEIKCRMLADKSAELFKETMKLKGSVTDATMKMRIGRIAEYLEEKHLYHQYFLTRKKADLEALLAFAKYHTDNTTGISVQDQYLSWRMGWFRPVGQVTARGVMLGLCKKPNKSEDVFSVELEAGKVITKAGRYKIQVGKISGSKPPILKKVELLEDGRVVAIAKVDKQTGTFTLERHFDMGIYKVRCTLQSKGRSAGDVWLKKIN